MLSCYIHNWTVLNYTPTVLSIHNFHWIKTNEQTFMWKTFYFQYRIAISDTCISNKIHIHVWTLFHTSMLYHLINKHVQYHIENTIFFVSAHKYIFSSEDYCTVNTPHIVIDYQMMLNTVWKKKFCLDHELTKDTPCLYWQGELCSIFPGFFGKDTRYQECNSFYLWPGDATWYHKSALQIASSNGLMPDSTKPLPGTNVDLSSMGFCCIHLKAI